MELLEYDIIEKILLKIHRFNYLGNICKVNKELNEVSKNVINFHYKKLNIAIDTECKNYEKNIRLYKDISKYLFNYKILNLKYYNFNKKDDISAFIKIIILYDELCSTKKKNLNIIKYNDYKKFFRLQSFNYAFNVKYKNTFWIRGLDRKFNIDIFEIKEFDKF